MNDKDIIREAMAQREWSQERLAQEAGFRSQSNITGILNRGSTSMRINTFVRLLNVMGFEVYVIDKCDRPRPPMLLTLEDDA